MNTPPVPLHYAGAELAARRLLAEVQQSLRATRRGRLCLAVLHATRLRRRTSR